jgi:polyhydroxyalkanoate synthesis repressor PhaR|tara:strand:- start:652336 stop:652812 length:477 start_codon:yes stop_codon:yes gene_type:complete
MAKAKTDSPTVVKKYANRRLYDTGRSSYVTLEDLCDMVKEGYDFVVVDAKSGDDITRQVLTQIIMEQESKGENLLPINFLKDLIGYYGDSVGGVIPNYLEQTMEVFKANQEQFQGQLNTSFGGAFPFGTFEEMNKMNIDIFQRTMKTFTGLDVNKTQK